MAELILPFKGGTSFITTRGGGVREEAPKKDGGGEREEPPEDSDGGGDREEPPEDSDGGGEREEPTEDSDGEHDVERDDKLQSTMIGVVLWDDDIELELKSMIKIFGTPI